MGRWETYGHLRRVGGTCLYKGMRARSFVYHPILRELENSERKKIQSSSEPFERVGEFSL
jgi:hypothetical protein